MIHSLINDHGLLQVGLDINFDDDPESFLENIKKDAMSMPDPPPLSLTANLVNWYLMSLYCFCALCFTMDSTFLHYN